MMKSFVDLGLSLTKKGPILHQASGMSWTNLIGAAAFKGNKETMSYLLQNMPKKNILQEPSYVWDPHNPD